MKLHDKPTSSTRQARRGWSHRFRKMVLPATAMVAAAGLAACEPAPPPDGRDLGLVISGALPDQVTEGTELQFFGTVTNHGTAPASGVKVAYAVSGGFSVSGLDFSGTESCEHPSGDLITCSFAAPLAPGASVELTFSAQAGEVSGSYSHIVAVGSDGTEPTPDPNPGHVAFDTDVRPWLDEAAPLPLGNGTNYLGTGNLLATSGSGRTSEGFNLGVSPYCADRVNGDRYQSGFSGGVCSGAPNPEYRPDGYTYVIQVPSARTSAIDVMVWDGRYNDASLPSGEASPDQVRRPGQEAFTFSLLAADDTPLDTTDNPVLCTQTFASDSAFDEVDYLGSSRWNSLCTIPADHPAGEYLVKVRNSGQASSMADGSNQFGLVARLMADGTDPVGSLCNWPARIDCPVVSGPGVASTWVDVNTTVAQVPLGEVEAGQEGRLLRLELFDPGEGMERIRIMAPDGASGSAPAEFTWSSPGLSSPTQPVQSLDVTNNRFNGRTVTIEIDLAGYQPHSGNQRWWVEYTAGPNPVVTDRTTWDAVIIDHPAP